jgi:hypothetical protein
MRAAGGLQAAQARGAGRLAARAAGPPAAAATHTSAVTRWPPRGTAWRRRGRWTTLWAAAGGKSQIRDPLRMKIRRATGKVQCAARMPHTVQLRSSCLPETRSFKAACSCCHARPSPPPPRPRPKELAAHRQPVCAPAKRWLHASPALPHPCRTPRSKRATAPRCSLPSG